MARSRILLGCGLLAPAVYLFADLLASAIYDDYSWLDQTISELFAIGAPTRSLVVVLFNLHNLLLAAFGFGVWQAAGEQRGLRITGALLVASALLGAVTGFFFPIHQRGVPASFTDTMHAVETAVQVVLIFVMFGCSARAFSRGFAVFTGAMIAILLIGGTLAGLAGGDLAANEPTPWMGATERLLVYGYLAWTAVLAMALLRRDREPAPK